MPITVNGEVEEAVKKYAAKKGLEAKPAAEKLLTVALNRVKAVDKWSRAKRAAASDEKPDKAPKAKAPKAKAPKAKAPKAEQAEA